MTWLLLPSKLLPTVFLGYGLEVILENLSGLWVVTPQLSSEVYELAGCEAFF